MSYEKEIAVVDALRNAYEKFKHIPNFGKRVLPFLYEAIPGYNVTVSRKREHCTLMIDDGKGFSMRLMWACRDNNLPVPWQIGFLRALDGADAHDFAEREQHEQALIPQLEKLDSEVQDRVRAARILIEQLPIPMSATVRNNQDYWSEPSRKLKEQFPLLFQVRTKD